MKDEVVRGRKWFAIMDVQEGSSSGRSGQGRSNKGPLKPCYLIVGDDQPKIERAIRRLKARVAQTHDGTVGDLNISEFWAEDGNAQDVLNAANTMAFLGGKRLVLVYEADNWKERDQNLVAQYLAFPAPDAVLCLVANSSNRVAALVRAVEQVGDVLRWEAPKKKKDITEWALKEALRLHLRLTQEDAEYLIQKVGEHQLIILRELEKLQAYVGSGVATRHDIDAVCSTLGEGSIFDLVDALARGEGATVFGQLEELLASGESPSSIFYRVLRHFERLAQVVGMQSSRCSLSDVKEKLKLKDFPARKLWQQAESIGPGAADVIRILAEADARMKGASPLTSQPADSRWASRTELELCLGRILARLAPSRSRVQQAQIRNEARRREGASS